MLIVEGFHEPVIPLFEVAGREGAEAFRHRGPIWVNVGVIPGLTVMVRLAVVAHCPAAGVKVYVVVAVLFITGDQVPLMPLVDVPGRGASASPEQIGAMALNVGIVPAVTVIVIVVVLAH